MDVARATSSPTRSSILRLTPGIGERTQSDVAAWTEARLVKSALIRIIGCACLPRRGFSHAKGAASRSATAKLALLLGAAIVAPPPHRDPLWMLVDPLRDVGLRIHDALIERHAGRERKMLILALCRERQRADGHHQFDQAHPNSPSVTIRSAARRSFIRPDTIFHLFKRRHAPGEPPQRVPKRRRTAPNLLVFVSYGFRQLSGVRGES